MEGMYVNPKFAANGNETEKYIRMIKHEKMEAAYQKKMREARKPKKKIGPIVVLSVAVAAACTAAYKAVDDLKHNGYSEIPVPRTEASPVKDVIIDVTDATVEVAAEPVATI